MSTSRQGAASFWTGLPPEGRWLLSTVAVQTLGRGLTLPFTIIYLHEVRNFGLGLSGVLMAVIAIVALLVTMPGGTLTDRYGARPVLLVGTSSMMVGNTVLAFATDPWVAAVAFVLIGINFGVSWPAFNALIAAVVTGEMRQRYFGINFALVNLGIGLGGVIGGFYVDVTRPETFTTIFLADAVSMLVPICLLLGPLRRLRGRVDAPEDGDGGPSTYLAIIRQPSVAWLTGLTFLAMFIGYGQLEAGFPAFAREVSEVSTRTIGIAFAVNTAVIVALQFWVLNRIAGHRRTRVMIVMALVWVVAWTVLGATGVVPGGSVAVLGVLLFHAVFAFGETMLQPTVPAITNDLAPDHLRGRYNAINAAAFQGGAITGPAVAGVLLQHDLAVGYVALMVVGCLGIVASALVLERRISPEVNGLGAGAATPLEPVDPKSQTAACGANPTDPES